jgi:hypothetical protein
MFNATTHNTFADFTLTFKCEMNARVGSSNWEVREEARKTPVPTLFESEEAYLAYYRELCHAQDEREWLKDEQIFWANHRHLAHLEGEELQKALEEERQREEEALGAENEAWQVWCGNHIWLSTEEQAKDNLWLEYEAQEAELMGLRTR